MKPLPAQEPAIQKPTESAMPSIPAALSPTPPASFSKSNRRASSGGAHRAYPWMLCASTIAAGVFCLMYITKPVIMASQANPTETMFGGKPALATSLETPHAAQAAPVKQAGLMPSRDKLPGETAGSAAPGKGQESPRASAQPPGPQGAAFEQTNLRVQHILTAEAPGGHVSKIDLDVPVLYQSRNLRWTPEEVLEARELLSRLADYQEKSQTLRAEGVVLLESWNRLIEKSIPGGQLRADSPTLPTNQQDAADSPRPAGLDTNELIRIQPAGK